MSPIICGPLLAIRDLSKIPDHKWTRGEKVIAFIEGYCLVPEGDSVGQPVRLIDFQKLFILGIYDNPAITDTAILSIARKNAKTATIAFLLLAHLVGPVAVLNSRIISGAMSREQAAEVYNLASKCVQISPRLKSWVKIIPSSKEMIGLPMNTEYKAISADAQTAHGKSPIVAILDEIGQVKGPQSDFIDAITTAQGAYKHPLLIQISTQAPTDAALFSQLIDDAKEYKPAKTVCHVYAAPEDCDLMDESAWRAANPAMGVFRSAEDVKKQAEKANRMPSFENSFRNLILNQRVSTVSTFVSRKVWEENGAVPDPLDGLKVYGGLDLSAKTDLTSLVLMAEDDKGAVHMHSWFWTPAEGILDRAKRDKVPYDIWAKQGLLLTTPGRTVDYEFVAADIAKILTPMDIEAISFDRWRIDHLKKEFDRIGFELPLHPHGQGYKDMAPAIDDFEANLLNGKIRHGMHPVLTMCAGNAIVTTDPTGGRKFDKSKATGRIDGMVAAAMAHGARLGHKEEPPKDYEVFFV